MRPKKKRNKEKEVFQNTIRIEKGKNKWENNYQN
jgi:hypothetical protein